MQAERKKQKSEQECVSSCYNPIYSPSSSLKFLQMLFRWELSLLRWNSGPL